MSRKTSTSLNLEVEQMEKLEKIADSKDRSVSSIVREAIKSYLLQETIAS